MPVDDVYVDTADSDTGPHDMGTFASRGTHRMATPSSWRPRKARAVMLEAAAEELEVDAADLVTDGRGQHPREGRAVALDHHHGCGAGGAVPAGQDHRRARHLLIRCRRSIQKPAR